MQTKTISIATWCQEWDREMKRETHAQLIQSWMHIKSELKKEVTFALAIEIAIAIIAAINGRTKWIKVSDAVTLWTRSNERQKRREKKQTHSTVNTEEEREVIIHLNSIATQHIPQSYQFTYSHSLFVLLYVMLETKHSVTASLHSYVMLFVIWNPSKNKFSQCTSEGTHNNKTQCMLHSVCVCISISNWCIINE